MNFPRLPSSWQQNFSRYLLHQFPALLVLWSWSVYLLGCCFKTAINTDYWPPVIYALTTFQRVQRVHYLAQEWNKIFSVRELTCEIMVYNKSVKCTEGIRSRAWIILFARKIKRTKRIVSVFVYRERVARSVK